MAYKETPNANDDVNVTQPEIKQNFTEIKTLIGEDHVDFDDVAQKGKHKKVTLRKEAAPVTIGDEVALYCKDNAAGDPSLFLRLENAGAEIDFTKKVAAAAGSTILPSGITLKWGFGTIAIHAHTTGAIGFVTPFTTDCYVVMITPYGAQVEDARDAVLAEINKSAASFYATRDPNKVGTPRNFRYLAIGI